MATLPDAARARILALVSPRAALLAQVAALRALADSLEALTNAPEVATAPPLPASPEPLVSRLEIARLLGCSIATLDRLIREGAIPYLVVGETKRFDVQAVRAALAARIETAPRPVPQLEAAPVPTGVRLVSRGGSRGAR